MNRNWGCAVRFAALVVLDFTNCAKATSAASDANQAAPFGSPVADETLFVHAILDQFEGHLGSESSLRWDGEGWIGTDTDRLWLKSEGDLQNGKVFDGQDEVFYDTPISTYFDLQAGFRYDLDSGAGRGWAALGIEGLSEYFFHVNVTGFASDTGDYAATLFGSYDLLITQKLILQPETEWNFQTKADPRRLAEGGIANVDSGLRLRYEISRKFAPYIGLSYQKSFGETGRLATAAGEKTDSVRVAVGLRAWF